MNTIQSESRDHSPAITPPSAGEPVPLNESADRAAQLALELARREDELVERMLARTEAEAAAFADARADIQHRAAAMIARESALARREEAIAARERAAATTRLSEPPAPASAAVSLDAEAAPLRRSRLARYRRLLDEQARKIVQARDAILRRQAECERVLAQREALAQRAAELDARERVLASQSGRLYSALAALAAVAALSIALVLAWAVAGQVAPSVYAARATIAPQPAGRDPTPEELTAWTENLQALVNDPIVLQRAAENFGRREMPDLGTPGSVRGRSTEALTILPPEQGQLAFEWRAVGAQRAERELESFLAAVLAVGEEQRQLRGEGFSTGVVAQPRAGASPIDSSRLLWTVLLTLGTSVLGAAFGVLVVLSTKHAQQRLATMDGQPA